MVHTISCDNSIFKILGSYFLNPFDIVAYTLHAKEVTPLCDIQQKDQCHKIIMLQKLCDYNS